tara:strand:+ start:18309 stop:19682 length:1374 start_codon:yes stop_codon:yes gene_type:complete
MAFNLPTSRLTLDGTGAEAWMPLPISDITERYIIDGTGIVAIGNYTIVPSGVPVAGDTLLFEYEATLDITTNGTTFSLFGTALTQLQLNSKLNIECYYNGSAWKVKITGSLDQAYLDGNNITNLAIGTSDLADLSVTTGKLANNAVTNAKMATMAAYTVKANNTAGVAVPTDVVISTLLGNAWGITGNAGTVAGTNFIGTTDNIDLVFKVNNGEAGRIDYSSNTSIGYGALIDNIDANNSAFGHSSLRKNTTGADNTGIGITSLFSVTTGNNNVGIGSASGYILVNGNDNTFVGCNSSSSSTSGINRIALGYGALATADYQFAIPTDITTVEFGQAVITTGTNIQKRLNTSAVNATGTATAAQIKSGYITSTSLAPTTITMPTGTLLGAALGASQGTVFKVYFDNTAGNNTVTIAVGVNAIQSAFGGTLTIPSGVTGQAEFTLMFSSATAYTFSRTA